MKNKTEIFKKKKKAVKIEKKCIIILQTIAFYLQYDEQYRPNTY